MFYITGDTHRDFNKTAHFCYKAHSTKDDTMLILGDAGINYYGGEQDIALKLTLAHLGLFFYARKQSLKSLYEYSP
jgi:3-oxoacid CoA-transferase subunit A